MVPTIWISRAPYSRSAPGSTLPPRSFAMQLHPIAHTEDRDAQIVDPRIARRRAFLINGVRTAGQHDAPRLVLPDRLERRVERNDLGIHVGFANSASDQLCVLRTEIEDENRFNCRRHYASLYQSPKTERRPGNCARIIQNSHDNPANIARPMRSPETCASATAAEPKRTKARYTFSQPQTSHHRGQRQQTRGQQIDGVSANHRFQQSRQ